MAPQITQEQVTCFAVGVVIVIIVIVIIALTNKNGYHAETNQTRTDITGCQPWQTREISRNDAGISFKCKDKESYVGLGGGGPRVCNYNQTTEVRGLPNGAGLLACADKPSRPLQATTRKTVNGVESFVNVGAVPGYNCTFKQTSKGADSVFGPQYTCMPVKVNVATAAAEGYEPKAYSFKTHSRANFMGTNYRNKFVPNLRNRVNFAGTDYRRRENLNGSMSSGESVQQPIGNNRTAGCDAGSRMVAIRRGPNADLEMTCETIQ